LRYFFDGGVATDGFAFQTAGATVKIDPRLLVIVLTQNGIHCTVALNCTLRAITA
jgi:hypothetical protein